MLKEKLRRIKGMVIKESYQILRDPSNIMTAFVLPAILLFIYGFGVSLDMKHMKLGLMIKDQNYLARSFAESFQYSSYFDVFLSQDREFLTDQLVAGNIKGIVVIPSYFSRYVYYQSSIAPVQVISDGSDPNTANFVQNYVNSTWNNWIQQMAIQTGTTTPFQVTPRTRYWYNEMLESRWYLIPGSIAIIMTLIGTLLTALVVSREWERGTMEALMATPITMGEIIISKLIPYYFLGLGSMAFCFLCAYYIFQVPFRGSFLLLLVVASGFLFAALGTGLLISSLARNQFVAYQMAAVSGFLPAFMLSGFIFEISSMPLPIQMITYLTPSRYFVPCLQTLFLAGNVWKLIGWNFLAMIIFGAILFTITIKKSVKRLD